MHIDELTGYPITKIETRGYVWIRVPDHPLAQCRDRHRVPRHRVPRHRFVLYDALGRPDSSPCHWCGWEMPWKLDGPGSIVSRYVVNADHLNDIAGDDRPENLVPSCQWCNIHRGWVTRVAPGFWRKAQRWWSNTPPPERPTLVLVLAALTGVDYVDLHDGPG